MLSMRGKSYLRTSKVWNGLSLNNPRLLLLGVPMGLNLDMSLEDMLMSNGFRHFLEFKDVRVILPP